MISIVIPNYNSVGLLKKNIPTLIKLLDQSKLEYEIIVSDDASTDDSVALLSGFNPVTLVTSSKNTGFGANVDRGIKAAKGEIVFILNAADILPQSSDFFKIMLKHFDDSSVFSVAASKKDSENHGSGKIYFEKGFYLHRRGDGIQTDWADGGAQALRKEYYDKIGGFDSNYFLYWEDVDLGFRAQKAGYKIIYEPLAVLIHQKHEGPIAKRLTESEIRNLNIRNQIYFTWKNSDPKHKLLFLLWLPYHFAISLKNRDWLFFKAYWEAFWCFFLSSS